jgi:hypothetical protein
MFGHAGVEFVELSLSPTVCLPTFNSDYPAERKEKLNEMKKDDISPRPFLLLRFFFFSTSSFFSFFFIPASRSFGSRKKKL